MGSSTPQLLILVVFTIFLSSTPSHNAAHGYSYSNRTTAGECGCADPPAPPPPPPQPSDFLNMRQYQAYLVIQAFKATITCDPNNVTASWVGSRPCNYTGFFCAAPPDATDMPTVASIDFNGFRLCAPSLVGFLDRLPDLALFHANSNNFSGPVPDLTRLPFLYELDLSNNNHSGAFPAAVIPLSNQLVFLDLRFNAFSGAVPGSVFLLDLDVLFLNNNRFGQRLPAELWSSPAAYLTLANNGFTGPIPSSIGNASSVLLEVLLLNNRLTGCLPYEIGLLGNVTVFDAGGNLLTGPIPLSFGCLARLEQLNLAGNLLYGPVPDAVCWLARVGSLANLSLSENFFTSIGHSCWRLLKSGVLDVRRNCIPGFPDQRPVAECLHFFLFPKFCPFLPFVPCVNFPDWPFKRQAAAVANGEAAPPPPKNKYVGYSALRNKPGY
ncbi:Uncharacterized protein ACMD2_13795 [Ananas comosus]|nr:Uncharacterized protein ACMD2_13795 [Ananas comosus]